MRNYDSSSGASNSGKIHAASYERQKGFIVFCETNLRYEKGFKAWIFLGPYLLGALALEMMIAEHAKATTVVGPWIGFLAYLILFPLAWRKVLKFIASKRGAAAITLR
jgi:hypothetical protein